MVEIKGLLVNIEDVNVDLGELPKQARKLIETLVRAGMWGVKPVREMLAARARVASAKADSEIARIASEDEIELKVIAKKGDRELSAFDQRMIAFNVQQETRRHENRERIAAGAISYLPEEVKDDPVDDDWLHQFFEECKDVGNEQMQTIWSKILAGEVAKPDSFSPRAISAVKLLKTSDAEQFTTICALTWCFKDRIAYFPSPHLFAADFGITNRTLLNLQTIGLIEGAGFNISITVPPRENRGNQIRMELDYADEKYIFENRPGKEITLTAIFLTDVGRELYAIAGAEPNITYRDDFINRFQREGFEVQRAFRRDDGTTEWRDVQWKGRKGQYRFEDYMEDN